MPLSGRVPDLPRSAGSTRVSAAAAGVAHTEDVERSEEELAATQEAEAIEQRLDALELDERVEAWGLGWRHVNDQLIFVIKVAPWTAELDKMIRTAAAPSLVTVERWS
jgi:hypothetical protein